MPKKNNTSVVKSNESTREAFLRVAVQAIDDDGEQGVRLEKVLAEVGVSASSLYHHFGNLRGLTNEAQAERFARTVFEDIDQLKSLISKTANSQDFVTEIEKQFRGLMSKNRVLLRLRRVNALGSSYQNPQLKSSLVVIQRRVIDSLALALMMAQAKGFIPIGVDVELAAAWVISTIFGGASLEIVDDSALMDKWNDFAVESFKLALGLEVA